MSFCDFRTTKKGDIAESIVDSYFIRKGCEVFEPVEHFCSHPIDRIILKDKKQYLVDVKCKSSRKFYPDAGFDYKDYLKYKKFQDQGHKVFIVFVDEKKKCAYGNFLYNLETPCKIGKKEYPSIEMANEKVVYFPLKNMQKLFDFTDDLSEQLKMLTDNNYENYS